MSSVVAIALLVSSFATTTPGTTIDQPASQATGASLHYVSASLLPVGISYGITAVDNRPLLVGEQANTRVSSGLRTVSYSCPDEPRLAGGSRLSFDFQAGQAYELVCHAGTQAEIRAAEGC